MPVLDVRPLSSAIGFLTRLPVERGQDGTPARLLRAAPLFPLVGAALGAAIGGVAIAAAVVLPALIAGALAVALELALTGALHVDGLADSADGLAGRDADRSLAIMRDHSLGTYGASALALDLLLKAAALGALAEDEAVLPVVAALALSRAAPLPLAAALPYARPAEGTGRLLAERAGAMTAAVGSSIAVVVALLAVGIAAIALIACLATIIATVGLLARRRLGGVTGDVMGATIELVATASLVAAVALEL